MLFVSWNNMLVFGLVLLGYFVVLGVFTLVKFLIKKKKFKKEVQEHEKEN